MKKHNLALAFALLASSLAWGQTYSGSRAYDGEHRNVIDGTLLGGQNVVTGSHGHAEAVNEERKAVNRDQGCDFQGAWQALCAASLHRRAVAGSTAFGCQGFRVTSWPVRASNQVHAAVKRP